MVEFNVAFDFLEDAPRARAAVIAFNHAHRSLFEWLHATLAFEVAAVYASCLIMAAVIVLPCFLPALLWVSLRTSSADASQSAPAPMPPPTTPPKPPTPTPHEPQPAAAVAEWSVEQVCAWLKAIGLEPLAESFTKHAIDGALLFNLTPAEIATDLQVDRLADRKRLAAEIAALRRANRWWRRWWRAVVRWLRRALGRGGAAPRATDAKKRD